MKVKDFEDVQTLEHLRYPKFFFELRNDAKVYTTGISHLFQVVHLSNKLQVF